MRRKKKGTPAQKAYRRETFRDRTQWAKWAYKEYPIYARLAAEQPMLSAYNLALSDISHPPVIHRILCRDGRILVQASDEVMRADIAVPSPHSFRRAFAIERWRAGIDIHTLSKLMGHTSLQVLNRYLKQAGEDLEQAARQSSPVDLNF